MRSIKKIEKVNIPKTFGLELLEAEATFNSGRITKDLIESLLGYYSRAVEYYSSKGNDDLMQVYLQKSSDLLAQPAIARVMQGEPYEAEMYLPTDFSCGSTVSDYQMEKVAQRILQSFKENQLRFEQSLEESTQKQRITPVKREFKENSSPKQFEIRRRSKFEDFIAVSYMKGETDSAAILDNLLGLEGKKRRFNQEEGLKALEAFIQQDLKEMYSEIEDIKQSYLSEINEYDKEAFKELVEGLRADMKAEIENIESQYSVNRQTKIEEIKEQFTL